MTAPAITSQRQSAESFLASIGLSVRLQPEILNPDRPLRYVAAEIGVSPAELAALRELIRLTGPHQLLTPQAPVLRDIYDLGFRADAFAGRLEMFDRDLPLADLPQAVQAYYEQGIVPGEPHFTHCLLGPASELQIVLSPFGLKSCGSHKHYDYLSIPLGDTLCLATCDRHDGS